MKAGSSYAIVFGKKLQTFAAETLGVEPTPVFAPNKEISVEGQGLTAVEKIFNRNAVGVLRRQGAACRLGRARQGQHRRLAGHHRPDDRAGARGDGGHRHLADRRRRLSVGLPHGIGVGQEGAGQYSGADGLHEQFRRDHRARSQGQLSCDDRCHPQGAERHHRG